MSVDENRAVARRFFAEIVSEHNLALLDTLVAPPLRPIFRGFLGNLYTMAPDWQASVDVQVAEGDLVTTLGTSRGTHTGPWASPIGALPATGKPFVVTWTITVRVADGQIVENVRSSWDYVGMLGQLGILPVPGAPA